MVRTPPYPSLDPLTLDTDPQSKILESPLVMIIFIIPNDNFHHLVNRKVMMHCSSVLQKIRDSRKTDQLLLVLSIKHFFNGDHLKQRRHIYLIKLPTQSDHL